MSQAPSQQGRGPYPQSNPRFVPTLHHPGFHVPSNQYEHGQYMPPVYLQGPPYPHVTMGYQVPMPFPGYFPVAVTPMPLMYPQQPIVQKRERNVLLLEDPVTRTTIDLEKDNPNAKVTGENMKGNEDSKGISTQEPTPAGRRDATPNPETSFTMVSPNVALFYDTEPESVKSTPVKDAWPRFEEKIDDLCGKNAEDIGNSIYSRELIQCLRDAQKICRIYECPVNDDKLKELGMDRATMPAPHSVNQSGKQKHQNYSYNNSQQQQWSRGNNISRNPLPDRSFMNQTNKGQNKPSGGRMNSSIMRRQPPRAPPKFTRGADAWTPEIAQGGKKEIVSLEDRCQKVRKDARGILNKITPSTAKDLSYEFVHKAFWKDEETLPTVIDLIFLKAVEEPTFVGIYSDLCLDMNRAEKKMEATDCRRLFYNAIVRKCQASFEATANSSCKEAVEKIQIQIKEETDGKKLEDLREQLSEIQAKEKRRMMGTIKFISHLFRNQLLNLQIVEACIKILLLNADSSDDELMVEYSTHFIESVGPHIAKSEIGKSRSEKFDLMKYVNYLEKYKSTVSNRIRFMIIGLEDLSKKNWQQKAGGPKTKEEVERDVEQEKAKNERERNIYLARDLDDSRRKRGAPSSKLYEHSKSRSSNDNKKEIMKKAQQASSASSSFNVQKNVNLNTVNLSAKLAPPKKAWGNSGTPKEILAHADPNAKVIRPEPEGPPVSQETSESKETAAAHADSNDKENHPEPEGSSVSQETFESKETAAAHADLNANENHPEPEEATISDETTVSKEPDDHADFFLKGKKDGKIKILRKESSKTPPKTSHAAVGKVESAGPKKNRFGALMEENT